MTSRTGTVRAALLKGLLRESQPCSACRELFYHCSPQMRNEFHVTDCRAPEVIACKGGGGGRGTSKDEAVGIITATL